MALLLLRIMLRYKDYLTKSYSKKNERKEKEIHFANPCKAALPTAIKHNKSLQQIKENKIMKTKACLTTFNYFHTQKFSFHL